MSIYPWNGQSGRLYEFHVFPIDHNSWPKVGGIYIFAAPAGLLIPYAAIYVGQTVNFADRLGSHEKLSLAQSMRANTIHAMIVNDSGLRNMIEEELIRSLKPPLNNTFNCDTLASILAR